MIRLDQWKVFGGTIELENKNMQVDHVDMEILVHDTTSRDAENKESPFFFTDVQFQPGAMKTGWIPDTKEMMDRVEFTVDEMRKYSASYTFPTITPKVYTPEELGYKRLFNILGRGHESIVFPNDLPEEEFWELDAIASKGLDRPVEILTTGIDFQVIPKDDFELCRISTNVGSLLPEEEQLYPGEDHPLNYRYTREFWFNGGQADDILEVNASTMTARMNGVIMDRNIKQITTGSDTIELYKNKFHLIPRGSVRFRIEFYGRDSDGKLADTGIGYGGTATFKQWTYGVERL